MQRSKDNRQAAFDVIYRWKYKKQVRKDAVTGGNTTKRMGLKYIKFIKQCHLILTLICK